MILSKKVVKRSVQKALEYNLEANQMIRLSSEENVFICLENNRLYLVAVDGETFENFNQKNKRWRRDSAGNDCYIITTNWTDYRYIIAE